MPYENHELVAIWADSNGLIPVMYFNTTLKERFPINPYTFAKNFLLEDGFFEGEDVIGKWEFDPEMTEDVRDYSIDETKSPLNHMELRKALGMEISNNTDFDGRVIRCYKNREPPEYQHVKIGQYGYIFIIKPRILDDIGEMKITHEVIQKPD